MDLGSNRLIAHVFAQNLLGACEKLKGENFQVANFVPQMTLEVSPEPGAEPRSCVAWSFWSPRWAASKWAVLRVLRWPSIPKWMKPISHPWVSDLRSGDRRFVGDS